MEDSKNIKGFKGFDKDFKCRNYQFAENKIFEENIEPKACDVGFHFCEMPLDVFNYYPPKNETIYAEVESLGDIDKGEDKIATNKLKIKSKLSIAGLFKMHFDIIKEKIRKDSQSTTGNYSHSSTTGYKSHSSTTGNYSHSSTTGDESISSALGVSSKAKAKRGWIILVEWEYKDKWTIKDIHKSKVGGKIKGMLIEPDVYYWIENGVIKCEK